MGNEIKVTIIQNLVELLNPMPLRYDLHNIRRRTP